MTEINFLTFWRPVTQRTHTSHTPPLTWLNDFISKVPGPKEALILAKYYLLTPSYLTLGSRGLRGTTSHPYILSQNLHWCLYKRPITTIILDLPNAIDILGM